MPTARRHRARSPHYDHRRRVIKLGASDYSAKVIRYNPIAYWPLDETAGAVAGCRIDPAQNGTAAGVTWANDATGPFRTAAPLFDGINDWIDIDTAGLLASLNTSTGSVAIWARMFNVGTWTDAATHHAWSVFLGANDKMWQSKSAANNTIQNYHEGSNVPAIRNNAGHAETAWMHWAMTWTLGSGVIAYVDGLQDGLPSVGLVTAWTGAFATAQIGSDTAGPATTWHGWLAHCAFWDRVLTPAEILDLANP